MAKVTHAEAQAVYPIRETFPAGYYGEAFGLARERAAVLKLEHVPRSDDPPENIGGDYDGIILPGTSDEEPNRPRILRWLGAVTLYYRPRAAMAVAR